MKRIIPATFLSVIILLLLASCSKDTTESAYTKDPYTYQIINQGVLQADEHATTVYLSLLSNTQPWKIAVNGEEGDNNSWCQASACEESDGWSVKIDINSNPNMISRHVPIILTSGEKAYKIIVSQKPTKQMLSQSDHIDVLKEGGYFFIALNSNSSTVPKVIIPASVSWLKYIGCTVGATKQEQKTILYHFTTEANPDLGRIADLQFSTDSVEDFHVHVHQWCRKLNKEENIHVSEPGQLEILLGGNAHDWGELDSLTLSGTLNTTDMQTLRIMLKPMVECAITNTEGNQTIESEAYLNLCHLNMKDCQLAAGGKKYSEKSIDSPEDTYESKYQELSDHAFDITRTGLQSIVLPSQLLSIGSSAFNMCQNLTKIDIPASVTHIGEYAFFNCEELMEVHIPDDSQLKELGKYALDTGSTLENISFPTSLQVKDNFGILGNVCAQNLHVKWITPPVLTQFRVNENTILHVPRGSAEAYSHAFGWNRAKEIVEE